MVLAACIPALTIIPVTPLLSTALAARPGDEISAKAIAELEVKQDWQGLAALALAQLKQYPSDDDWMVVLGYARMRAKDYSAAIAAFSRVAQRAPEDADARNLLGESLRLAGRADEAVGVLEKAVASHTNSVPGWFLLGQAYTDAQRLERAKAAYREAVRLEPEYGDAWLGLAAVLERVGPREEYEATLKKIHELSPALLAQHQKAVDAAKGAAPTR